MSNYTIHPDQYPSKAEYDKAVQDAKRREEKVIKVTGGYMAFETAEDYRTWKNQK